MHPPAVLRPGRGFRPGPALLYFAQRLVVWPPARRLVRRGLAGWISRAYPELFPKHAEPPAQGGAREAALRRDGIVAMESLVPEAGAKAMAAYFAGQEVVVAGRTMPLGAVPAGTAVAPYPLATVLACPGLVALINHPAVLRLAAAYLGCAPTLSSLGVRWALPAPGGGTDIQRFHRDPDDWHSVKLFVYLTEVDAGAGPHVYIRGSHRTAGGLRARPFGSGEAEARFGAANVLAVTGPAGTSFMADVHGVHRGAVPTGRPRLMLQAQYSLLPVYAFRYEPLPTPPPLPVDPYVNRLLFRPSP
ncbi:hypothetical protein JYK14_23980 [Siccirubricoccus sp. KC 17139]|uniref:Phytanoyl-CoA dioxygenase n=1 Tax=Siccirubricoccus soli TaxID=2899147 RepID=A0ABT1DB85_9PROT|nr:hypothetical protein [Siccirubricoccus soli]MCO6419196.1 hypothetical protein [Siccirubricoccus soli]MCP2685331.1 hypothetical protein [Siccirubricoccus soli]